MITSIVAALFGLGGGLLLIGILPLFIPGIAVIPVHGVTQLVSNISRACLAFRSIEWRMMSRFIIGSMIGVVCFGLLLVRVPTDYVPLAIGIYILLNLWYRRFAELIGRLESIYVIGFLQTGLGLFVGATGPLASTILLKNLKLKEKIVATSAVFMAISHCFKIVLFGFFGFQFADYAVTLGCMVIGATLGSLVGTQLRQKIEDKRFTMLLRVILTFLAVKMVGQTLAQMIGADSVY